MPRLKIDVSDYSEVLDALSAGVYMQVVAEDAVTEVTARMLNKTRKNFLAQKDPHGVSWEPSRAAFFRSFGIRNGKKVKAGGGTLYDTGNLFHSIQLSAENKTPLHQELGTDVPYASAHNFGVGQVKRQFIGYSPADELYFSTLVRKKIQELLP